MYYKVNFILSAKNFVKISNCKTYGHNVTILQRRYLLSNNYVRPFNDVHFCDAMKFEIRILVYAISSNIDKYFDKQNDKNGKQRQN